MARYVDGFLFPIKKKHLAKYKKMAMIGRKTWMKYGALDYYECISDELETPYGGLSFGKLTKLKKDEVLVFAYIVYKSKTHRNTVNKKVHKAFSEMPMQEMEMLYDSKRFSYGGFAALVNSK